MNLALELDLILIIHTALRDQRLKSFIDSLRINRIENVLKLKSWFLHRTTLDQVKEHIDLLKEENYLTQPKYSEFLNY
jgi:hypothetical protein